jgi:hypothetical protein
MAKLVWRVKLVTELQAGETTEVEVARIERDEQAGLSELSLIPSFQTTSKSPLNDPHFETVSAKRAMSGNSR